MLMYARWTAAIGKLSRSLSSESLFVHRAGAAAEDKGRPRSAGANSLHERRCDLSIEETFTRESVAGPGFLRMVTLGESSSSSFLATTPGPCAADPGRKYSYDVGTKGPLRASPVVVRTRVSGARAAFYHVCGMRCAKIQGRRLVDMARERQRRQRECVGWTTS